MVLTPQEHKEKHPDPVGALVKKIDEVLSERPLDVHGSVYVPVYIPPKYREQVIAKYRDVGWSVRFHEADPHDQRSSSYLTFSY